jgi:hypothetical protein
MTAAVVPDPSLSRDARGAHAAPEGATRVSEQRPFPPGLGELLEGLRGHRIAIVKPRARPCGAMLDAVCLPLLNSLSAQQSIVLASRDHWQVAPFVASLRAQLPAQPATIFGVDSILSDNIAATLRKSFSATSRGHTWLVLDRVVRGLADPESCRAERLRYMEEARDAGASLTILDIVHDEDLDTVTDDQLKNASVAFEALVAIRKRDGAPAWVPYSFTHRSTRQHTARGTMSASHTSKIVGIAAVCLLLPLCAYLTKNYRFTRVDQVTTIEHPLPPQTDRAPATPAPSPATPPSTAPESASTLPAAPTVDHAPTRHERPSVARLPETIPTPANEATIPAAPPVEAPAPSDSTSPVALTPPTLPPALVLADPSEPDPAHEGTALALRDAQRIEDVRRYRMQFAQAVARSRLRPDDPEVPMEVLQTAEAARRLRAPALAADVIAVIRNYSQRDIWFRACQPGREYANKVPVLNRLLPPGQRLFPEEVQDIQERLRERCP